MKLYLLLKQYFKYLARVLPFALTKNEYYDRLTFRVIKTYCSRTDVCVDVGAHDGKILQFITKHCDSSTHYAFEPLPFLYKLLVRKFGSACHVYSVALGKEKRVQPFNYVQTSPAYSGLKKRAYDRPEVDELIQVQTDLLDNYIPQEQRVKLIKIDVEGGEFDVLLGAKKTINHSKPIILFEFGKAGAEAYQVTPAMMFNFFNTRQYFIYLLGSFLKKKTPLTLQQFTAHYTSSREYFFIAYTGK